MIDTLADKVYTLDKEFKLYELVRCENFPLSEKPYLSRRSTRGKDLEKALPNSDLADLSKSHTVTLCTS